MAAEFLSFATAGRNPLRVVDCRRNSDALLHAGRGSVMRARVPPAGLSSIEKGAWRYAAIEAAAMRANVEERSWARASKSRFGTLVFALWLSGAPVSSTMIVTPVAVS